MIKETATAICDNNDCRRAAPAPFMTDRYVLPTSWISVSVYSAKQFGVNEAARAHYDVCGIVCESVVLQRYAMSLLGPTLDEDNNIAR